STTAAGGGPTSNGSSATAAWAPPTHRGRARPDTGLGGKVAARQLREGRWRQEALELLADDEPELAPDVDGVAAGVLLVVPLSFDVEPEELDDSPGPEPDVVPVDGESEPDVDSPEPLPVLAADFDDLPRLSV